MAGIAYSEDRTEQINYPDSEMLNETFYIYKAENDSSIQCGNINSYNGKKIGVLKNNQRMVSVLEKWKSRYHVNIECVYYTDMLECSNAFNKKEIDAFASADNVVSYYSGITPVEQIGKQPFYLCVAKDRTDLLSALRVSHLLAIVNEVLEISRIESGQTKLDEAVCNLEEIIKETDIIIRNQALEKKQHHIRRIFSRANAFDEDREASRRAGMNGHLAKPIVVSDLLEILVNIIFTEDKKFLPY